MEDDDPFFAGDDGFVWPELSSSDEVPDNNVAGITMCSVPSTPESVSNLGFSKKLEDEDEVDEVKSNLVVEDGGGEIEIVKESEVNDLKLSPKLGFVVEDDNGELEINRKGGNEEEFRVNLATELMKLEAKSSLNVDDEVIEIVKDDKKNEGFKANSIAKASNLPRNSSLLVEDEDDDDDVLESVGESGRTEVNLAGKSSKFKVESSLKGVRVDLAGKELKLGESSSLNVEIKKLKKRGINKVTKALKMAGNSSLNAMACLSEMLQQIYGIEKRKKREELDILRTVKCRGMSFPCNRFLK